MNGQNVDGAAKAASIKFANELQKYPPEVAVGVGVIIPNLVNGCSWGFVNDSNTEYKKCIEAIKANPNMSSFKVRGGYLVNMNMDYLLSILNRVASGYVRQKDLQIASQHRQKALLDLRKFLRKGGQGKIGIYNLNDSPRITVKGISYPSFCVTVQDLLAICVETGYGLNLGGTLRSPGQVASHILEVVERLEVAPSGNALFIEVQKLR